MNPALHPPNRPPPLATNLLGRACLAACLTEAARGTRVSYNVAALTLTRIIKCVVRGQRDRLQSLWSGRIIERTTIKQTARGTFCFIFSSSHFESSHYTLALPPSSNSDPGSHSGASSPIPTTMRAFIFIARRLMLSARRLAWKLYLPTLLGALSSCSVYFAFLHKKSNLTTAVGIELKDQP